MLFWLLTLVAPLSLSVPAASAADTPKPVLTGTDNNDLPPYTFSYSNGLYGTLAGYLSIPDVKLDSQKVIKLKVNSFKGKVPVRAIIQQGSAPLVVVLLGVDGEARGKLGRLWPSWYAAAGCHVLTFDSTFLASFIEISGHGVTGNIIAESERVRDIIEAFLKSSDMKGKVTKLGVVGMSYGGLEALVLGQMANEGKLPFKIDAIQAYSPPVRLQKTGMLIDKWYAEDRWNYTLIELSDKLTGHKPVPGDTSVPFDDSMMRAGIAAIFRLNLADVIVRNDRMYKLNLLPTGNNFDDEYVKKDSAATWGYTRFMTDLSYPYWRDRLHLTDVSELTRPVQLDTLLEKQPAYSETVIAEDDPFNESEDTNTVVSRFRGQNLTVLPHGGHLGFVSEPWTKAKLLSIFKITANRQALLESNEPAPTK